MIKKLLVISSWLIVMIFIPTVVVAVDIGKEYDFGNIPSLGEGINRLVAPAFSIATLAVVIYFLIGAFKYLTSGGDKESVGEAQKMITHTIVGFIILMFAFLILQFIPEFFGINFSIF